MLMLICVDCKEAQRPPPLTRLLQHRPTHPTRWILFVFAKAPRFRTMAWTECGGARHGQCAAIVVLFRAQTQKRRDISALPFKALRPGGWGPNALCEAPSPMKATWDSKLLLDVQTVFFFLSLAHWERTM